jgi:hypothetical protein
MESSNLKNDISPIFIIGTCKENQHPTLLQTTSNLVLPIKYHGSYNEGCQKNITT